MDAAAFGADVVAAVRSFLEQEVDPLLSRIEALEKQLAEQPKPKDGKDADVDEVAALAAASLLPDLMEVRGMVEALPAVPDVPAMIAEAVSKCLSDDDLEAVKSDVESLRTAIATLPLTEKGKDADPAEMERMVAEHVQRTVAALPVPKDGKSITLEDVRPLIEEEVTKAVTLIPVPKDGINGKDGRNGLDAVKFFRDDKGHLIVVKSDGSTDDLGEYVGKDGAAGERGKDGADGVGFDDMLCEIRDDGVYLVWEKGDLVKEARLPIPMDRGVYKEGQTYRAGDGVTWGGSYWFAQEQTTDKPDSGKGWRLAIKKGRDGKDAPSTKPDPKKGK